MIKFLILLFPLLAFSYSMKKGPMTIGSDQHKPDGSAVLDLFTNEKGFLPPRLNTSERDGITTPAPGLEIYNTDRSTPEFFNGVTWIQSGGTGTSFLVEQTGHGRSLGCPLTPVYWDGAAWADASADATSTLATHVITKVVDVDNFEVSQSGRFECPSHGLTLGTHYYTAIGGGLSSTPAPVFNNPVLLSEDANIVHIMPYRASSTAQATVGQVDTVFGRIGNVVATLADYSADLISVTPAGNITATEVQTALEDLDALVAANDASTKAENSIQIILGDGLNGGGDLTADVNIDLDFGSFSGDAIDTNDSILFIDSSDSDIVKNGSVQDLLDLKTLELDELTDVSTVGFAAGQVLEFDGGSFVAGDKTVDTDDQTAIEVPFAPNGDITSTDVQTAIQEVRDDTDAKLLTVVQPSRQVIAGLGLSGGGPLSSDVTLSADPSNIDITALQNYNPNSYLDHSTVAIDVTDINDGLLAVNPTLENDVTLRVDIPSLTPEVPALPNTDVMAFSNSLNRLVKVSISEISAAAIGAFIAPVDTVNGKIGNVVLHSDDISDVGRTNKWATAAQLTAIGNNSTLSSSNASDISTLQTNVSNNTSSIIVNTSDITANTANIATNTSGISTNASDIAALSTVASTGDYNDLLNLPTLGTAAATNIGDYATAAQGLLADSALQSGDNISELVNDANYITAASIPVNNVNGQTGNVVLDADDISDAATINKFATAAELSQITTNTSNIATNVTDIGTNASAIATNVTDIGTNATNIATNVTDIGTNATNIATNVTDIGTNATNIATNVTDIGTNATNIATNVTDIGTNASAIAALSTVASTGDYNDLLNLPTLGTAAATDIGDYATAAQGLLADSALQSGDNISELVNDAGYITSATSPVTSVNTQTGVVVLDADDIDDTSTINKWATQPLLDQITTNATDTSTNATAISNNSSNISTNTTNISNNTSAIALKYDASNPNGYETPSQLNTRDTNNRARANHTGTQLASTISDFDTAVAATPSVTANTAKVTNATHTGEVTGNNALTVQPTAITNKPAAVVASNDLFLFADVSDSNNLKSATVSQFLPSVESISSYSYTLGGGEPYIRTNQTAYTIMAYGKLAGTSTKQISRIKVIARREGGSGAFDVRIVDNNTGLVIAESLNNAFTAVPTLFTLTTITNQPVNDSIFRLELRKVGGGGEVRFFSLDFEKLN